MSFSIKASHPSVAANMIAQVIDTPDDKQNFTEDHPNSGSYIQRNQPKESAKGSDKGMVIHPTTTEDAY